MPHPSSEPQIEEQPAAAVQSAANDTETTQTETETVLADLLVEEVSIDGMCGVY